MRGGKARGGPRAEDPAPRSLRLINPRPLLGYPILRLPGATSSPLVLIICPQYFLGFASSFEQSPSPLLMSMDNSTRRTAKEQGPDAVQVAARKLKKRELDRKAQRLARERTKNRINELESLVEQLKADSNNPEVSNLTATLSRVTQQRNELQNVVKSIDQTVQRYLRQQASSVPRVQSHDSGPEQSDAGFDSQSKVECLTDASNADASRHRTRNAAEPWQQFPPEASQPSEPLGAATQQVTDTLLAAGSWDLPPQPSPSEHQCAYTSSEDIIVPRPDWPCDCVQNSQTNTWRDANKALGKSTMLSPAQLAIEDFTSEDTPVRVILEGWESVAKSGKMSLSWRKLREIDQACFSTCGDVERLGILRTMHLLMTYHGDPSQQRCEKIPRWLWTR